MLAVDMKNMTEMNLNRIMLGNWYAWILFTELQVPCS